MQPTKTQVGILLAAGKGTRLNCTDINKTALKVQGKPLAWYGARLFEQTMDHTVVVVGAFAESVRSALSDFSVSFATQETPDGTGHAVQEAVRKIDALGWQPTRVFIGYGDHLMFYTPELLAGIQTTHETTGATLTLVSVEYDKPDELAWGRVIRDDQGAVIAVIEQKDATPEERRVTEENAGFYCCEYEFLRSAIWDLKPSVATGELYLTDIVALARTAHKRVSAHQVPFSQVGTGVNTPEQLQSTDELLGHYSSTHH